MVGTRMEGRMEVVERRTTQMEGRMEEMTAKMRQLRETVLAYFNRVDQRDDGAGSNNCNRNNEEENRGGGNGGTLRDEDRIRRLEVPYFTGDDPYGWVYRAERYFWINHIGPEEQIEAASICMEGKALNWFQWWESRNPINDWGQFRAAILQRFHTSSSGNPFEALMCLRQGGTVAEYRENFEMMAVPLRDADEGIMRAAFLNGLKEEIRAEIRLHRVEGMEELMSLAQRVEEK